jgi:hypothetical protein
MIGVSGEQPPRGRLLKPRQKSEKSRQNRRAGEIGHEFRRDNSAAARDCPIRTSRIGRGSGSLQVVVGLGGGPIIRGWASDDASAPFPAVRAVGSEPSLLQGMEIISRVRWSRSSTAHRDNLRSTSNRSRKDEFVEGRRGGQP